MEFASGRCNRDEIIEIFYGFFRIFLQLPTQPGVPSPGKDRWVEGGRRQFDVVEAVKDRWLTSKSKKRFRQRPFR